MNKLFHIVFLGLIVLFSSCLKDSFDEPAAKPSTRGKVVDRTILVYLAADNNLRSFAVADVQEMIKGIVEIDDTRNNLLVYMDTGSNPELFRLGKDTENNVIKEVIREYPDQNSVDTEVMKGIFSEAFSSYPAENYGLVLWSHAEGWIPSPSTRFFGQDGNNFMDISELKKVFQSAPYFDFIYFEACFMSGVEVLYELRGFTDYFIACPTEAPGPGAPYDEIVPLMFDSQYPAVNIATTYFDHYKNKYNGGVNISNSNWTGGASIAVVKTNQLEGLASVTRQLLPVYLPEGEIPRNDIICYDKRSSYLYHYDMDSFIKLITNQNEDYLQWRKAFDKAVIYYNTTEKNYSQYVTMFSMIGSSGLSTYIPRASQAALMSHYRTYAWYKDSGWADTGW